MTVHDQPSRPPLFGVIFDLDGVLVTTDELHYQGWLTMAKQYGIPFDRTINNLLRGLGRLESLEKILERASRTFSDEEKHAIAAEKNERYRESLNMLTPADLAPGAAELLNDLESRAARRAIASSSRNAGTIVDRLGIRSRFDAIVDGNDISASKPDPEVFLKAAAAVGVAPSRCVVIEDAQSGVDAARAAGMKVIGIFAAHGGPGQLREVDFECADLTALSAERIAALVQDAC